MRGHSSSLRLAPKLLIMAGSSPQFCPSRSPIRFSQIIHLFPTAFARQSSCDSSALYHSVTPLASHYEVLAEYSSFSSSALVAAATATAPSIIPPQPSSIDLDPSSPSSYSSSFSATSSSSSCPTCELGPENPEKLFASSCTSIVAELLADPAAAVAAAKKRRHSFVRQCCLYSVLLDRSLNLIIIAVTHHDDPVETPWSFIMDVRASCRDVLSGSLCDSSLSSSTSLAASSVAPPPKSRRSPTSYSDRLSFELRRLASRVDGAHPSGLAHINRVESELENVSTIMKGNIDKVMQRGEKIHCLVQKAELLKDEVREELQYSSCWPIYSIPNYTIHCGHFGVKFNPFLAGRDGEELTGFER
eukprot:GHVT01081612.1.p1 GENE.GHVT01081612.1~~GHVT01081612.1.p1  ORF type:complete len:360 (+),score=59.29 GHVT01081612.1:1273-2352(+)